MKAFFRLLTISSTVFVSARAVEAKDGGHCPSHVRFIHGEMFRDQPVDVFVDGKKVVEKLQFRGVTDYLEIDDGPAEIKFVDSVSGKTLESKALILGSNLGYTVALAGPTPGPDGNQFKNTNPFVFIDDITPVTNIKRWKGTWYRLSETNAVIDLRVSKGDGSDFEVLRLKNKENKASYNLGDNPAGVYQFHPVLIGSSQPLLNEALDPPAVVKIAPSKIAPGFNFDVIALGNGLGKGPNSLQLTSKTYRSELTPAGCLRLKTN